MGTDGYVLVYRAEKRFYNAGLTTASLRLFPRLLTGGKPVTTSQYQASVACQFPFVDFQKLLLGCTGSVAKTLKKCRYAFSVFRFGAFLGV